jgi:hypothetical protein
VSGSTWRSPASRQRARSAFLGVLDRQPFGLSLLDRMTEEQVPEVPGFTVVQFFDDPTPNAIIQHRVARRVIEATQQFSDLTQQEQSDFIDLVLLIARKMCSVWNHLDAYHAEELRLLARFSSPTVKHIEYSQVLYEEFDVFAVQIKSALDHLVKSMRPMLGRSWTLYTFADKGNGVLKALQNNTGKKHVGRVKSMEHLLFSDKHKMWLEAIISSRDRMNHGIAGGMRMENFAVLRRPDGHVELPMWSNEQKLGTAMDRIWESFFNFVEDFLMLALHFRIPEDKYSVFKKSEPLSSPSSPWRVISASVAREIIRKNPFNPV